jgi:acyl carrier protein
MDILDELEDELNITISDEAIEETPEDMFNLLLDNILEISYQKNNQK